MIASARAAPYHPSDLHLVECDLCDPVATLRLIEQIRPDRIFHLAGQAYVGDSWANPWQTMELNLRAQINPA